MGYKIITAKFIKILILILLIFTIFYLINKTIKNVETFNNKNIPLDVYQTWHIKELPPNLLKYNNILKKNNPEFTFHLYDDNECREFIKKHFDKNVLDAYDKLIPGAYKADLWRYCILYIKGGIYLDIKYYTINNFKLLALTDKEYFVKDRPSKRPAIYNALIISAAGNKILLDCINKIVKNVSNNYYGNSSLEVTGPLLLIKYMNREDINNIKLNHSSDGKYILFNNKKIMKIYNEYRDEQKKYSNKKHYGELWKTRNIYMK